MNQIMKVAIIALATAALGLADSWTGKLIDATCKPDSSTPSKDSSSTSCAATTSTKVFAIQTADGKVFRLDDAGNAKAAAALKNDPTKTSVTVSGSLDGQMVKVESVNLQ
jgi:hypothetical protein